MTGTTPRILSFQEAPFVILGADNRATLSHKLLQINDVVADATLSSKASQGAISN
jgi:hypothetical protein